MFTFNNLPSASSMFSEGATPSAESSACASLLRSEKRQKIMYFKIYLKEKVIFSKNQTVGFTKDRCHSEPHFSSKKYTCRLHYIPCLHDYLSK